MSGGVHKRASQTLPITDRENGMREANGRHTGPFPLQETTSTADYFDVEGRVCSQSPQTCPTGVSNRDWKNCRSFMLVLSVATAHAII